MITLRNSEDISFQLTARNEKALKQLFIERYRPTDIFLIEETGELIALGDIFNFPENHCLSKE